MFLPRKVKHAPKNEIWNLKQSPLGIWKGFRFKKWNDSPLEMAP